MKRAAGGVMKPAHALVKKAHFKLSMNAGFLSVFLAIWAAKHAEKQEKRTYARAGGADPDYPRIWSVAVFS
ncbi:MAG: hypothetical protein WC284_15000 [Candidimonas sp.]